MTGFMLIFSALSKPRRSLLISEQGRVHQSGGRGNEGEAMTPHRLRSLSSRCVTVDKDNGSARLTQVRRTRREFTKQVKRDAAERAAGHCEAIWESIRCNAPLPSGGYHYDHSDPEWISHDSSLENCEVLCLKCHRKKTSEQDQSTIARAKRIIDREHGIKPLRGRQLPCGKNSPFKKTFYHGTVRRAP